MKKAERGELEHRWAARPFRAGAVRLVAFAVPIVASTLFAFYATSVLPRAGSLPTRFAMWAVVAVSSTGVLIVVDHGARRLLPLAALLSLSIVFPDRAPSRFKVARRAGGVRNLRALIDEARRGAADRAPAQAATTILELVTALRFHDRRTRGHSERVHVLTEMLAKELKLPDEDRDRLRWAALVHDVGKLTVPVPVLNKPGRPDPDEWEQLRNHPIEGSRLCAPLRDWMGDWWYAIEQHHERYDGTGYPRGLRRKDISLGARVVTVADSFEVMTAARSYKRAMSVTSGRHELTRCAGTQFDPEIVRAFLNISIGRLRLAVGPLAGLAHLPGLDQLIRAGSLVRPITGLAAAAGIAATMGAPSIAEQPVTTTSSLAAPSAGPTATVDEVAPAGAPAAGATEIAPDDPVPTSPPGPEEAVPAPTPPAAAPTPPAAGPGPPGAAPSLPAILPALPSPPPGVVPTVPSVPLPTPGPAPLPTVPPVNLPPLPVADVGVVGEDAPVTIDVLRNDADPDGDPLVVVSASHGANGRTTVNASGTVTYTPDDAADAADAFTYRVSDGSVTAVATVTIAAAAVDDPLAFPVPDLSVFEDAGPWVVPQAVRIVPATGPRAPRRWWSVRPE